MRDGGAVGQLAPGPLDVDMDPLVVAGRLGETVDALLRDQYPIADPDLLADGSFHGGEIGKLPHGPLHSSCDRAAIYVQSGR